MFLRTLLFVVCLSGSALAQSPGLQSGEGKREQEWRIPTASGNVLMDSTVFLPSGGGKHPLVVINHGSPPDENDRPNMKRPRYSALSSFFIDRGYVVVLPLRRDRGRLGRGIRQLHASRLRARRP
jgi:predicted acyl esterase